MAEDDRREAQGQAAWPPEGRLAVRLRERGLQSDSAAEAVGATGMMRATCLRTGVRPIAQAYDGPPRSRNEWIRRHDRGRGGHDQRFFSGLLESPSMGIRHLHRALLPFVVGAAMALGPNLSRVV